MKRHFTLLTLLIFVLTSGTSYAEEYKYLKSESPYKINSSYSIILNAGDTLIIEPGVKFQIDANRVLLFVNRSGKTIPINGTKEDPIVFQGIDFSSQLTFDRAFTGLRYLEFHDLGKYSSKYAIINSVHDTLSNLVFDNTETCFNVNEEDLIIKNCRFINFDNQYIIYLYNANLTNFIFSDNLIKDCKYFRLFDWNKGNVASLIMITGNKILNNIGAFILGFAPAELIINNIFYGNSVFYILNASNLPATVSFRNNLILNNRSQYDLIYLYARQNEFTDNIIFNNIVWDNSGITNDFYISLTGYEETPGSSIAKNNIIEKGEVAINKLSTGLIVEDIYEVDPDITIDPNGEVTVGNIEHINNKGIDLPHLTEPDGSAGDIGLSDGSSVYFSLNHLVIKKLQEYDIEREVLIINLSESNISLTDFSFKSLTPKFEYIGPDTLTIEQGKKQKFTVKLLSGVESQDNDTLLIGKVMGTYFNSSYLPIYGKSVDRLNGTISGVLSPGSPYFIEEISVPESDTLAILPGTELISDTYSKITIDGVLICGNKNAPTVNFRSLFPPSSGFRLFFNNTDKKSIIANTLIESGYVSEEYAISLNAGATLLLKDINFTYKDAQKYLEIAEGGAAFLINSTSERANLQIKNNGSFYQGHTVNNDSYLGYTGSGFFYIINNTFYNVKKYWEVNTVFEPNNAFLILRNNIFILQLKDEYLIKNGNSFSSTPSFYIFEYNLFPNISSQLFPNSPEEGVNGWYNIDYNLDEQPDFTSAATGNFTLASGSPGIDKGTPNTYMNDLDGSRNDIGYTGGKENSIMPLTNYFTIWHNDPKKLYFFATYFQPLDNLASGHFKVINHSSSNLVLEKEAELIHNLTIKSLFSLDVPGNYSVAVDFKTESNDVITDTVYLSIQDGSNYKNGEIGIIGNPEILDQENLKPIKNICIYKSSHEFDLYPESSIKSDFILKLKDPDDKKAIAGVLSVSRDSLILPYIENGDYKYLKITGGGKYRIVLKQNNFSDKANLPTEFTLGDNYPNPFNSSSKFSFYLPKWGTVSIDIFNILGQKIKTLIPSQSKEAGWHNIFLEMNEYPSGNYFLLVRFNTISKIKRIVLIK